MQIREKHLPRFQLAPLLRLRLLHLDDHVRGVEHVAGRRKHRRRPRADSRRRHADALTRVALDDHLVAVRQRLRAPIPASSPTRFSRTLISFGTPMRMRWSPGLRGRKVTPARWPRLGPARRGAWGQSARSATARPRRRVSAAAITPLLSRAQAPASQDRARCVPHRSTRIPDARS